MEPPLESGDDLNSSDQGACHNPLRIHLTGLFPYIWLKFIVNEGNTIHGSYGQQIF